MKKTFTINISGSVFHIDEDAYEKLQNYLLMLSNHFGGSVEGREILQDIEARIAELFNLKMKDGKDVIIDPWVDEVIERMGKPEDFMDASDSEETAQAEPVTATEQRKVKRRLYRDPDHRVIGGVCSGMGAYFNIDPVILRIVFVVLFFTFGSSVLLYLILWIAVPKARTTAQRLEMKGEEATVSNIEKSIKEEVKEVKDSFKRMKDSATYEKGKEGMSRLGEFVYNVAKIALRVLVIIVGVVLIIAGFFSLLGFLSSMIVGQSILHNAPWMWGSGFHMPDLFGHFVSPGLLTLSLIAIAVVVGIPLLMILFIGTKMVFRYKTNNRMIGLASVGLWVVALFTLIMVSVGQFDNFSKQGSTTTSTTVDCQQCNTLILELGSNQWSEYDDSEIDLHRMKLVQLDGKDLLLGEPRLNIEKSSGDQFAVLLKKKSRGEDQEDAQKNAENIVYNFMPKDSVVTFDPYYALNDKSKWRDQEVDIIVKVPVGKSIYMSKEMVNIIYDIENVSNTWDRDMVGKYWIMTEDGLALKEDSVLK